MPEAHPRHRIIALLDEAIRRDVHFFERHPTTLFQCLWNTCWWYDCPEAERQYEPPADGWPPAGTAWQATGPKLSPILEQWRTRKESATPGFWWVRSARPPESALGCGQLAVLQGHSAKVECVALSADALSIAAVAGVSTRIWDANSGRETAEFSGPQAVESVAFSPDGCRVATGHYKGQIHIWDLGTRECTVLQGHDREVQGLAFVPDGNLLSGSDDGSILKWDLSTREHHPLVERNPSRVSNMDMSADGRRLAFYAVRALARNSRRTVSLCWTWQPVSKLELSAENGRSPA